MTRLSRIGPLRPLLTATAVLAALSIGFPAAPARAAVPADWAGINAQWAFSSLPRSAWDVHADAMQAAGVKIVRLDAEWRRVEPVAPAGGVHEYRWEFYDSVVATLAARGIRWYPIVDYSAPWSGVVSGQWRTPPASTAAFAEYAAALARRYGPDGAFWAAHPGLPVRPVREWEIWNEENGGYFWPPAADPAAYADLYLAAHRALHAVDPGARVVVGGLLARGSGAFVSGMLAARPELHDAIDAVGLHAYGATVAASLSAMVDLRNWLTHLGIGAVPIEVTEVGWTTSGVSWAVSDATRASELGALLSQAAALPGISRLLVHTWMTREQWPAVSEDWYGLFHPDGTPSASGSAFARALADLRPPAPTAAAAPPPAPASSAAGPGASAAPAAGAPAAVTSHPSPTAGAGRSAASRRCLRRAARLHGERTRARARRACARTRAVRGSDVPGFSRPSTRPGAAAAILRSRDRPARAQARAVDVRPRAMTRIARPA